MEHRGATTLSRIPGAGARLLALVTAWLDGAAPWKTSLVVGAVLTVCYLPAAQVEPPYHLDAASASYAAWAVANDGSLVIDDFVDEPRRPWFVMVDGHILTNRQPGVIAHGVPASWLWGRAGQSFAMAPTVWTASLITAAGVALLHLALRRITTGSVAFGAALILGLATTTWAVSAAELWPHGIGQFWLAVSLIATSGSRYANAGSAFGIAVFTRPPLAIAAAATGLGASWRRRSLRPAFALGAVSVLGVLGLLAYNLTVFGEASLTGGYSDSFLRAKTDGVGTEISWYFDQVRLAIFSRRGLVTWSPFLIPLLLGLRSAWRTAEPWVKDAAIAGTLYMLIHLWLNRYSGGGDFFAYRYPLEPLVLWAPLLTLSWETWVKPDRVRQTLFLIALLGSTGLQVYGAFFHRGQIA